MALVLIVDDSPTDVHVMQKALEQNGFRTASAADAVRKPFCSRAFCMTCTSVGESSTISTSATGGILRCGGQRWTWVSIALSSSSRVNGFVR